MEVYLVKSSGELEYGTEYWENLQVFNNLKLARNFAAKIKRLIRTNGDPRTEKVEIETFTLRTEDV